MSKGRTTNSKQHVETTNHGYDVDDFLVERNELSDCLVYFVVEKWTPGFFEEKYQLDNINATHEMSCDINLTTNNETIDRKFTNSIGETD